MEIQRRTLGLVLVITSIIGSHKLFIQMGDYSSLIGNQSLIFIDYFIILFLIKFNFPSNVISLFAPRIPTHPLSPGHFHYLALRSVQGLRQPRKKEMEGGGRKGRRNEGRKILI